MLEAEIPAWVDLGELDASFPHGYGRPIPAGAAPALRLAADKHRSAMAPAAPAERHAVLMGLRSGTILRDEDADEAEATVKLLRVHLDDVPLDILQAACRAYCNAPGRRFFPRSAGELRTFISPLQYQRQARVIRLERLAAEAEKADARRAELEADPLTSDTMHEILAAAGERARARLANLVSATEGSRHAA